MNKKPFLLLVTLLLTACIPISTKIQVGQNMQVAIAQTLAAWTPIPTYTPLPTYTPQATIASLSVAGQSPAHPKQGSCKPFTDMDYSDDTKIAAQLQAYVSQFPDVKSVSDTTSEKLYGNTLSELYFVQYISADGNTYAKRFIVYLNEFGWLKAIFSIDGQCWIDAPR